MGFSIYIDLVLMPLSLAASFYLIWLNRQHPIYASSFPISAYFCLWANTEYILSTGDSGGGGGGTLSFFILGLAFLLLATTSYYEKRLLSLISLFCVLGTVGMLCGRAFSTSDEDLVKILYPDETGSTATVWAWAFRSFLMVHNVLWGTIFGKIIRERSATNVDDGVGAGTGQYSSIT